MPFSWLWQKFKKLKIIVFDKIKSKQFLSVLCFFRMQYENEFL